MAIQWGDTGRVVIGALRNFNITVNPNENLLGTPQNLGTSAPTGGAAGDISYTIQTSDLPTFNPSPISTKYTAYLIICGQNNSGASVTLTYNVLKNGSSVVANQTHTGVTNANYWTHSHYRWYDVKVGDTIEVQTWASAAGVTLNYWAVLIFPTRLDVTKSYTVRDLNIIIAKPLLTKGNPSGQNAGSWNMRVCTPTSNFFAQSGSFYLPGAWIAGVNNGGYGLGDTEKGDRTMGTTTTLSPTYYPYNYQVSGYPSVTTFREVLR